MRNRRWARAGAAGVSVLLAAGCAAGAGGKTPVVTPAPAPTAAAESAPPDQQPDRGGFAGAPGLVGTQPGRSGDRLTGPVVLPLVHRADPTAEGVRVDPAPTDARDSLLGVAPTADHAAFYQEATAVTAAAIRIESLPTREVVERVDLSGQGPLQLFWSPDGRAVAYLDATGSHVHRLGGVTVDLPDQAPGRPTFSSDARTTAVAFCSDRNTADSVHVGQSGDAAAASEQPGRCDSVAQGLTAAGDPVGYFLLTPRDGAPGDFGMFRASNTGPAVPVDVSSLPEGYFPRLLTRSGFAAVPCGTLVRFQQGAIYDLHTGVVTVAPAGETCPVAAPDHSRYAVATADGPVVVVDAGGRARPTVVAQAGSPVAWSADGSQLVVEGRGTFLVQADGSGGRPASVQVGVPASTRQTSGLYCRVGDTGLAVIVTADGPVLYDVAADTAAELPDAQTADTCWVTPDSRWLVTGSLVVDVRNRTGLALLTPGRQTPLSAFSEHRWVGSQLSFGSGRLLR